MADGMILVNVSDLEVTSETKLLFRAKNIQIQRDSSTIILMPSGSGRTSLAHFLADIPPPNSKLRIRGEKSTYSGSNHLEQSDFAVSLVSQNYYHYITELRVIDQLLLHSENKRIPQEEAEQRANEAAQLLGISHLYNRNPLTLSGGEIQRLGIAVAVASQAHLIILDEPFSELDEAGRKALENIILNILPAVNITSCVISSSTSESLLSNVDVYALSPTKYLEYVDLTEIAIKPLYNKWMTFIDSSQKSLEFQVELPKQLKEVSFMLNDLTFQYPGSREPALSNITLDINLGDWLAISGPNGAGKSTLVSLLLGFERAVRGTLIVNGEIPTRKSLRRLRARTGILNQTYHHYFFGSTVREELQIAIKSKTARRELNQSVYKGYPFQDLADVVKCLSLTEVLDRIIDEISVQQRRLLGLATVLIQMCDVLILDEPTAGLDSFGREIFKSALNLLPREEVLVIAISHDEALIRNNFSRRLCLLNGRMEHLFGLSDPETETQK